MGQVTVKKCSNCEAELPLSSYSRQKTNPGSFYRWCDPCRAANVRAPKPIYIEWNQLREKAKDCRKLSDADVTDVRARYGTTATAKELAQEYNCGLTTIYKAAKNGYKR